MRSFASFAFVEQYKSTKMYTVNVEIFAQYIFSRISRSALDARKYDVIVKMKHYRSNRINYKMRENLSTRKCPQGLDARKFSCPKIYRLYNTAWKKPTFYFLCALLIYDVNATYIYTKIPYMKY